MARSLKKGPFADESLLKKVDAMNASGDKSVIKTDRTSYRNASPKYRSDDRVIDFRRNRFFLF